MPSFVVSDDAWGKSDIDAPAFSTHGQIYFQETIPESYRGMVAPHEITHVMRQVEFAPYLDFVERTPTMLDMGNAFTQKLLEHIAAHQHTTVMKADATRLYDELNATIYGHICSGKMDGLIEPLRHVFRDFDAYARELTEIHQRFKAENSEGRTKFSLKSPVEETRDLLALHNLTEENLLEALKLGGMPMPSIAVVKAEAGHAKYGPISLVFSKDTIDPQLFRGNKVYGGDGWTPTAPQVEYQVNSKKLFAVEQEFHKLSKDLSVANGIFGNSSTLRSMGVDEASGKSAAELAKALAQTDTIRAAYLASQGKTLEPVKQAKVWDRYGNATLQKFIDQVGSQRLAEMEAELELGRSAEDALGSDAGVIDKILRDYYRQSGEAFLRKTAVKNHWTAEQIEEKRQARINKAMENNVTPFTLENIIRHAWEMYEDGGATKGEIDRMATSEALREAVNDSDVEAWAAGKLEGLLGEAGIYNGKERYTPSGNSRSFAQLHYAYTLENIVKAMQGTQKERGEGIWGASAGTLMATATPEYQTIEEIRADKSRLRTADEAEYQEIKAKLDAQIEEIILGVRKTNRSHSDNEFEEIDLIGTALVDASSGKKTDAAIRKAFRDSGYTISDQLIAKAQQLYREAASAPTEYFEAKPQRAVGFDEVLAAVIPSNASKELQSGLEQAGVETLEYQYGDDGDRLAKVNSVENAKFSLKAGAISKSYEAILEENDLLKEQMKDYLSLRRQNERLRESRDYWRGQTRTTQRVTTDQKSVAAAAKRLLQSYSSEADVGDIQKRLQSLYDFMASGFDGENELSYDEARRRAEDIARTVVENAVVRESAGQEYQELLDYLKTTKIIFGKEHQGDIPDYGNFRKRQRGRMNLSGEGRTNMDQVYQELSNRWPEFFDEQEQSHPADQLLQIADVLDRLHSITEYNPFEGEMYQTVTGAANEIMEGFFDLPQTRKTFADRQAAKLNAAKANDRPLHTGWGTGHRERDKGLCHIGLPLSHTVPQLPGSSRHI